jgi:hypothetical protein
VSGAGDAELAGEGLGAGAAGFGADVAGFRAGGARFFGAGCFGAGFFAAAVFFFAFLAFFEADFALRAVVFVFFSPYFLAFFFALAFFPFFLRAALAMVDLLTVLSRRHYGDIGVIVKATTSPIVRQSMSQRRFVAHFSPRSARP